MPSCSATPTEHSTSTQDTAPEDLPESAESSEPGSGPFHMGTATQPFFWNVENANSRDSSTRSVGWPGRAAGPSSLRLGAYEPRHGQSLAEPALPRLARVCTLTRYRPFDTDPARLARQLTHRLPRQNALRPPRHGLRLQPASLAKDEQILPSSTCLN